MGLVSGVSEMALRQFNILKMCLIAGPLFVCNWLQDVNYYIAVVCRMWSGYITLKGQDSLLSFAIKIINKRQTSTQVNLALHSNL